MLSLNISFYLEWLKYDVSFFTHEKREGILVGTAAIQMSRKKARKQNEKQNLIYLKRYLKRYGIMAGGVKENVWRERMA